MTGAAFLTGRPRLIRPVLIGFTVLCLADWVLIEDFGFLGGLGTDPNSMIPMALLAIAGYLALAAAPCRAAEPAAAARRRRLADRARLARDRVRPAAVRQSVAAASIQSVAAVGAIGLIILGAAPMAAAQANPVADTDPGAGHRRLQRPAQLSRPRLQPHRPARPDRHAGQPARQGGAADVPRPGVHDGLPADRAGVPPGRPAARRRLPPRRAGRDQLQPLYTQVGYLQAFDRQEGLDRVPNWLYLTGTRAQLQQVWQRYGLPMQILPAGSMIGHGDYAFVIDQHGHMPPGTGLRPRPGHRRPPSRRSPPS